MIMKFCRDTGQDLEFGRLCVCVCVCFDVTWDIDRGMGDFLAVIKFGKWIKLKIEDLLAILEETNMERFRFR